MNIKTNVIHDWVFSFGKKRTIELRDDQLFCRIGSSMQVFNLADIHDFSYTKKSLFLEQSNCAIKIKVICNEWLS